MSGGIYKNNKCKKDTKVDITKWKDSISGQWDSTW